MCKAIYETENCLNKIDFRALDKSGYWDRWNRSISIDIKNCLNIISVIGQDMAKKYKNVQKNPKSLRTVFNFKSNLEKCGYKAAKNQNQRELRKCYIDFLKDIRDNLNCI